MKLAKLPAKIFPNSDAKRRLDYKGIYSLVNFTRLQNDEVKLTKDVQAQWSCDVDPIGIVVLKGSAETEIETRCERCLQNFLRQLKIDFAFSPIVSINQVTIPDYYTELLIDEFGEADILSAIEDEFIFELPIVNLHKIENCAIKDQIHYFGNKPEQGEVSNNKNLKQDNPFEVLRDFKSRLKK